MVLRMVGIFSSTYSAPGCGGLRGGRCGGGADVGIPRTFRRCRYRPVAGKFAGSGIGGAGAVFYKGAHVALDYAAFGAGWERQNERQRRSFAARASGAGRDFDKSVRAEREPLRRSIAARSGRYRGCGGSGFQRLGASAGAEPRQAPSRQVKLGGAFPRLYR